MVAVAYCDDCEETIWAMFQINLKQGCVEYIAPYPIKHDQHEVTYTKNGLLTWT